MTGYYRDLAAGYDWLYDDDALTGGFAITRPAVADLLRRAGPGCAVLDAACGTGADAAALTRRGFHVRAAGGSDAMAEAAHRAGRLLAPHKALTSAVRQELK